MVRLTGIVNAGRYLQNDKDVARTSGRRAFVFVLSPASDVCSAFNVLDKMFVNEILEDDKSIDKKIISDKFEEHIKP